MNIDETIKRLRELEAKVGLRKWSIAGHSIDGDRVLDERRAVVADCFGDGDVARFIAAARNALPTLLDELERLRAGGGWCPSCEKHTGVCAECEAL